MYTMISESQLLNEITSSKEFLLIQDLDGVCIPLVKDPLTREIKASYLKSAAKLNNEFAVLTNGEHDGVRGVNRLVEKALGSLYLPSKEGMYLPGLAAGGIEYQNKFGNIEFPGVTTEELQFLKLLPIKMKHHLRDKLIKLLPMMTSSQINNLAASAILDTRFSPTINLNGIFSLIPNDIDLQKSIQLSIQEIMNELIEYSQEAGLYKSFYLHIAPNLGKKKGIEIVKYSRVGDVGTTDIQFMISGAKKEAGLLVLINKYIQKKSGKAPLGETFNVRNAPQSLNGLKALCQNKISNAEMPVLIGVGDTVTSNQISSEHKWLRGGSDRGFLTLIQELGKIYNKPNKVVLVDSSGGEVDRPNLSNPKLEGISDPEDPLKFNTLFKDGPNSYVDWFEVLASSRKRSTKVI